MDSPATQTQKTVLVAEPDMSGHHADAARTLMRWLRDQGARVIWGKFDNTKVPDETLWHELMTEVETFTLTLTEADHLGMAHPKITKRQHAWWKAYRRMNDEITATQKIDLVVVAYVNSMDKVAGLLGSPFRKIPWSGMSMRDSFHHQAMGVQTPQRRQDGAAEWLFRRTLKRQEMVAWLTLDPTLEQWAKARLGGLGDKVVTYPDIGEVPDQLVGKSVAREKLELQEKPTISLVGSMELRKGVADAIKCLVALPEFQLLLAGRFQPECHELMETADAQKLIAEGRLKIIDRRISPDELQWAMEAADIIWAVYQGHYFPSNVMTQAACVSRPLLGTTDGLIGERIKAKNLGEVADTGDISAQVAAIRKFMANPTQYDDGLKAYAESQSSIMFGQAMGRAFRSILGS